MDTPRVYIFHVYTIFPCASKETYFTLYHALNTTGVKVKRSSLRRACYEALGGEPVTVDMQPRGEYSTTR